MTAHPPHLTQSGRFPGLAETGDAFVSYHSLLKHINRRTLLGRLLSLEGFTFTGARKPAVDLKAIAGEEEGDIRAVGLGDEAVQRFVESSNGKILALSHLKLEALPRMQRARRSPAPSPPSIIWQRLEAFWVRRLAQRGIRQRQGGGERPARYFISLSKRYGRQKDQKARAGAPAKAPCQP